MQTPSQEEVRRAVAAARTVVVKVGSSSLTQPSGHLDVDKLNALVGAIAQVRMLGGNIVLVSSGAIAAGFGPLGFESRPTDVATQQATASVGQGLLMAQYEMAFGWASCSSPPKTRCSHGSTAMRGAPWPSCSNSVWCR